MGEVKPVPRGQRVLAGVMAVVAVGTMALSPSCANALAMCGLLLGAWHEAFYLSPSSRLRLHEIYVGYRDGHFQHDLTGRIVSVAAVLFLIASFAVRLA